MSPALRLAACAVALAGGFSGGSVVGQAVGPLDSPAEEDADPGAAGAAGSPVVARTGGHHSLEVPAPGGLLVSQSGYTLEPQTTVLTGGGEELFAFRIAGPDGLSLLRYERRHERELHLVLVPRDLTTYHHLHPALGADGTWTVLLPALEPGSYHVFASFVVAEGPELTLSVDLLVPGETVFRPLPETGDVVILDGYAVFLQGRPVAGVAAGVTLTVAFDGVPVTDLEPYLGAFGHLVAIRAGDLAYSHVHPVDHGGTTGGPDVQFMLDVPSPGDYRLFFDFLHGGGVRTAAFTVHVPAAGPAGAATAGTTAPPVTESPTTSEPTEATSVESIGEPTVPPEPTETSHIHDPSDPAPEEAP